MIQIYTDINKIKEKCEHLLDAKVIKDFRIYLKTNNTIVVYIKTEREQIALLDNENIRVELFNEEVEDDLDVSVYFESVDKVNISHTHRRLGNVLDAVENVKNTDIPVITFYSYKGGVGRSTSLASCATYLAMHHAKKIVILDCDFEAPGFTNFFLSDSGSPSYSNGIIEYLLDQEYLGASQPNVRNYLWEVSKEYSGQGEIYVMPSGNLDDTQFEKGEHDRQHYLQGLARIDFSEKHYIVDQFYQLIKDIKKEITPDVILIDSRTGFNDIFGITAFRLADLVVGFFGNNTQTLPGIHFFIDAIRNRPHFSGILVNAIIPAREKRKWIQDFEETVDAYIEASNPSADDDNIDVKKFAISRDERLEVIGTRLEDQTDFINLIKEKSFVDYVKLFEYINEKVEEYDLKTDIKIDNLDPILTDDSLGTQVTISETPLQQDSIFDLKKSILQQLQEKMPELYAADIADYEVEFKANRYFYRNCMQDLFNLDKFLVLGNKGTGKSYIYKSLKNNNIVQELKRRANKTENNYRFINIVEKGHYFIDTIKLNDVKAEPEKFYERFWVVYIWNVLMTEFKSALSFDVTLPLFPIQDKTETAMSFIEYIENDQHMVSIERDLDKLDAQIQKEENSFVVIVFDELDWMVKPHKWNERIVPLINLCKKFSYSRIYPKLFLRSDLFARISGLNNIQSIKNKAINIEWSQQELFSYFFKLILAHSKEDFFKLMKIYSFYPPAHDNKVRRKIDKDKQPPLDDDLLRHLSATFFGRYADVKDTGRFGESYDWLYRNLKNANDTISLRPFIDLISIAVDKTLQRDKSPKPILPAFYFTHGQARADAVGNHFNDLASEDGNRDLKAIFEYLRSDATSNFKLQELKKTELDQLLQQVIAKHLGVLENKTSDELIYLLEVNGVIRDRFPGGRDTVQKTYRFALLYKYYLGLRNRRY